MFGELGKHVGGWLFAGLVIYLAWVLIAPTPLQRIERSCALTEWVGRSVTSLASIASDKAESKARVATGEVTLSCRYFVYRQFFRDQYLRMKAEAEAQGAAE